MPTKTELLAYAKANDVDAVAALTKAEIEQAIIDAGLNPEDAASSSTTDSGSQTTSGGSAVSDGNPQGPFHAGAIFDPSLDPESLPEMDENASQEERNYRAWLEEAHAAYEEGEQPGEPETPAERQEREEEAHEEAVAAKEERATETTTTESSSTQETRTS